MNWVIIITCMMPVYTGAEDVGQSLWNNTGVAAIEIQVWAGRIQQRPQSVMMGHSTFFQRD